MHVVNVYAQEDLEIVPELANKVWSSKYFVLNVNFVSNKRIII